MLKEEVMLGELWWAVDGEMPVRPGLDWDRQYLQQVRTCLPQGPEKQENDAKDEKISLTWHHALLAVDLR